MSHTLSVDIETFSETDIKKCGSFRYVEDPAFEVLLFGFAYDNDPVEVLDLLSGDTLPKSLLNDLYDPRIIKTGWNNAFERYAFWKHFRQYCPPEQWEDSMVLAAQCGLPASLDGAGKALGLGEDAAKMSEGKALIRYFCQPCKPTKTNGGRTRNRPGDAPEKWETFKTYNGQDVVAERSIRNLLLKWKPNEREHQFWCLDARINENGVRIDKRLAVNAVAMDRRYKEELTAQAVELTGLENPKSVSQVKNWLMDQEGQAFPSLNKKVIADVVSQLQTDEAREFMALRSELSKSSTAKYEAMLRSMCPDDHCKGCFQFYGANRTGRFAGRLVQFQNMSKNEMSDLEQCRDLVRQGKYTTLKCLYDGVSRPLSELVRTAIIPEEGCKIMVADFSAIEARVIAWFAGEQWRLDVFTSGGDIYCASASQMFKVPVVKHGENGHLRQKGKIAELALGYGGGINALKAFGADKMGMTQEEMQETVDLWRESSPKICALWKALEKAAIRCVARRGTTTAEMCGVRFDFEDGILWMTLPSGRRIAYFGAKYEESRFHPDRKVLSYMGVNQQTKKWERVETWGGKLTENCWAAGTPVLTNRGWVPIECVTPADLVWDGVEWVANDGPEFRYRDEALLVLDGLLVTGGHKILTTEGWKDAKACNGLDRLPVQLPEGAWARRDPRLTRAEKVACAMRLRTDEGDGRPGYPQKGESRTPHVLRLHEGQTDLPGSKHTWNDKAPRLQRVAFNDSAVHGADTSGVEKLRWSRYHCLRALAARLSRFLGRHGTELSEGAGTGPAGQRKGLFAGKLPLGNAQRELPKQAKYTNGGALGADYDGEKAVRAVRHQVYDAAVSAGSRLSVRKADRRAGYDTPVYDLMNCGPRHRYVVRGEHGPIIAHNCVQATARDCLRESMMALDEAGYDIRAHVHDEVIVSEPIGGRSVEEMADLMGQPISWAPGLPLRADGYETPFYKKD